MFMREKGFVLFDLRTTRSLGNSGCLDPRLLTSVLGNSLDYPPNAQRLAEVDAVFMRDPRELIQNDVDAGTLRRLIAILIAYNFFAEAVFSVVGGRDKGIFSASVADTLLQAIGAVTHKRELTFCR